MKVTVEKKQQVCRGTEGMYLVERFYYNQELISTKIYYGDDAYGYIDHAIFDENDIKPTEEVTISTDNYATEEEYLAAGWFFRYKTHPQTIIEMRKAARGRYLHVDNGQISCSLTQKKTKSLFGSMSDEEAVNYAKDRYTFTLRYGHYGTTCEIKNIKLTN